jgi:hypothetical protein
MTFSYGTANYGYVDSHTIAIRGISGAGTTGVYIDDTPMPDSLDPRAVDIARIDVLKGPQCTLFGQRSLGGNLRLITVAPKPGTDAARFAGLGVIAGAQPTFCCSELGTNFDPADPTPSDRWHTLRALGVVLAFGSDWPCTWPPDPFVAMQQAVLRQKWRSPDTADIETEPFDGAQQGGAVPTGRIYQPEERISIGEAVGGYTLGAAYAAFADDRVGSLEVGKLADLAVLSQDVFSVAAQEISATRVEMTIVGGRVVYERAAGTARSR